MRALVFVERDTARIEERPEPEPADGEVVVAVRAAGVCGTDRELLGGTMPYLRSGEARYPLVPGHEWSGVVVARAAGVDVPVGARVTGDVFIGCRRCRSCLSGMYNVCPQRYEVGVRGGWDGALAEQVRVPARIIHLLPDSVGFEAAAFVEPGVTALHAVERAGARGGTEVVVWGSGTLGLLALQIARYRGAVVDCVGVDAAGLALAHALGARATYLPADAPANHYDSAIEASGAEQAPRAALAALRPAGTLALIGVPGGESTLEVAGLVHRNATVAGVLGGPGRFATMIELLASGAVDPGPLIARRVALEEAARWIRAPSPSAGGAPKTLVIPAG